MENSPRRGRVVTRIGAALVGAVLAGSTLTMGVAGALTPRSTASAANHRGMNSSAHFSIPRQHAKRVLSTSQRVKTPHTVSALMPVAPARSSSKTFTVDTTSDSKAWATITSATCEKTNASTCSVRAAIWAADHTNGPVDNVSIPAGTYQLSSAHGQLNIYKSVVIKGAEGVYIKGGTSRIVDIFSTTTRPTVWMSQIEFKTGSVNTTGDGADVLVQTASLVATAVAFMTGAATVANGAGLAVEGVKAHAWLTTVSFTNDVAGTTRGGGLYIYQASVVITKSTFTTDTAPATEGGAIFNAGTLTVSTVHFYTNDAKRGGAIANTAQLHVEYSTFFYNTATSPNGVASGAAIFNLTNATVLFSVMKENSATASGSDVVEAGVAGYVEGGVIYNARTLTAGYDRFETNANHAEYIYGGLIDNAYTATVVTATSNRPASFLYALSVYKTENASSASPARAIAGGDVLNEGFVTLKTCGWYWTNIGYALGFATTYNWATTPTLKTKDIIVGGDVANLSVTTETRPIAADISVDDDWFTTTHDHSSGDIVGGVIGSGDSTFLTTFSGVNGHNTVTTLVDVADTTTYLTVTGTVWGGAIAIATQGALSEVDVNFVFATVTGAAVNGLGLFTTGHMTVDALSIYTLDLTDQTAGNGSVYGGAWDDTTTSTVTGVTISTITLDVIGTSITGGGLRVNDAATVSALSITTVHAAISLTGSATISGAALSFVGSRSSTVTNSTFYDNEMSSATPTSATPTVVTPKVVPAVGDVSVVNVAADVSFVNDTIGNNAISFGSAQTVTRLVTVMVSGSHSAVFENTIVAGTPTHNCYVTTTTGSAQIDSIGGNIDTGTTCGFKSVTDQSTTTPLFGSFGYHYAHAVPFTTIEPDVTVQTTSPAIGHGLYVGAPAVDEGGQPRSGRITVGAYQFYGCTPSVSSITPSTGTTAGGTTVTIHGTCLNGTTKVAIGATNVTQVTPTSTTTTSVVFNTHAHAAGTVTFYIEHSGTWYSTSTTYTYVAPCTPAVTSISPASGPTIGGTSVTLTGTCLVTVTTVGFGTGSTHSLHVTVSTTSSTSVNFSTPAHLSGTVKLWVKKGGSWFTTGKTFTYNSTVCTPSFTSITPATGPVTGGTVVTIRGTCLSTVTTVGLGPSHTTYTSPVGVTSTSVTFITPTHAAGVVTVWVKDGSWINTALSFTFTTTVPPPSVSQRYTEVGSQGAWYHYAQTAEPSHSASPTVVATPAVVAATDYDTGILEVAANGYTYIKGGYGKTLGNPASLHLNAPIVGVAAISTTTGGYWMVAADGGVFAYGSAFYHFYGSMGGAHLNQPVVGMAAMSTGMGYWLVASDGGIFAFGAAATHFYGSMGGLHLNQPVVGMAAMSTNDGYWLVAADGGIFAFGAAATHFYGSTGGIQLNQPIVGMLALSTGMGYWLVARDGGIFAFGTANYLGSVTQGAYYAPTVAVVSGPAP